MSGFSYCPICREIVEGFYGMKGHVCKEPEPVPIIKLWKFTCEICNEGFNRKRLYEAHLNTHKKKRKYKLQLQKPAKELILKRDEYKCRQCNSTEELHVHHIVHRAKGGTNDPDNLITLCEVCHIKEHEGEAIYNLMISRRG